MKIEVVDSKIPRIRMSIENWNVLGTLLYGKERMNWKFKCPACGKIQMAKDFEKYLNPEDSFFYSFFHCLSRYSRENNGKCSWKLDGAFQIHKIELVIEGEVSPAFEFADALVTKEDIAIIEIRKEFFEKMGYDSGEKEQETIWKAFIKEGLV